MMTPSPAAGDRAGYYFVLSRAGTAHDESGWASDHFVEKVFVDLCKAVESRWKRVRSRSGYLDPGPGIASGETDHAVSTAEVFIALRSAGHTDDDHVAALLRLFRTRASGVPADHAAEPPVWVLHWEPPAGGDAEGSGWLVDALASHSDYARVGLAGLARLTTFHESYTKLLDLVGQRIVDVAERSSSIRTDAEAPGSAVAASLGQDTPPAMTNGDRTFVVAVLAPHRGDVPAGRDAEPYGSNAIDWRPFGKSQTRPVAWHVATGFPAGSVEVVNCNPDEDQFAGRPGVLLVDPWIVMTPSGRERLVKAVSRPSPMVVVLALSDRQDIQFSALDMVMDDVVRLCESATAQPVAGGVTVSVTDRATFAAVVPVWTSLIYRRFRDRSLSRQRKMFSGRPRIVDVRAGDEEDRSDD
jgi:FxsC-like protein